MEKTIQLQKDKIAELEEQVRILTERVNVFEGKHSKPVIGYWDVRGLAQPIMMQLTYLGVDYETKLYKSDESRQDWLDDKATLPMGFPNLPYFVDTNGYRLSESLAIQQYTAEKWMPSLLGSTPEKRAEIDMLAQVIKTKKVAI